MSELVQIGRHHFRFQCQPGCINCCTRPGEVYLTNADATRIAAHIGVEEAEFRKNYCIVEEGDLRLANPPGKGCLFLLENGCSIHSVKPTQCATFPYWPENVGSKRAWKRLSDYCPGIGMGEIVSKEEVERIAQISYDAFPDF